MWRETHGRTWEQPAGVESDPRWTTNNNMWTSVLQFKKIKFYQQLEFEVDSYWSLQMRLQPSWYFGINFMKLQEKNPAHPTPTNLLWDDKCVYSTQNCGNCWTSNEWLNQYANILHDIKKKFNEMQMYSPKSPSSVFVGWCPRKMITKAIKPYWTYLYNQVNNRFLDDELISYFPYSWLHIFVYYTCSLI